MIAEIRSLYGLWRHEQNKHIHWIIRLISCRWRDWQQRCDVDNLDDDDDDDDDGGGDDDDGDDGDDDDDGDGASDDDGGGDDDGGDDDDEDDDDDDDDDGGAGGSNNDEGDVSAWFTMVSGLVRCSGMV